MSKVTKVKEPEIRLNRQTGKLEVVYFEVYYYTKL